MRRRFRLIDKFKPHLSLASQLGCELMAEIGYFFRNRPISIYRILYMIFHYVNWPDCVDNKKVLQKLA